MKNWINKSVAIAALLAAGVSVSAVPTSSLPNGSAKTSSLVSDALIAGDYVEARTAAVFAGACHYNGELVTTGRDALMAWSFTAGSHDGVSLAGVRAMAAVTSHENLIDTAAGHQSEIVVDPSASAEQVAAVVSLLKSKCSAALGTVTSVHRAPITFVRNDEGYNVEAVSFGSLIVKYLPDNACCVQPGEVWYEPLSPTENRKVGYTESAAFNGELTAPWYRHAENGAFYGSIQF